MRLLVEADTSGFCRQVRPEGHDKAALGHGLCCCEQAALCRVRVRSVLVLSLWSGRGSRAGRRQAPRHPEGGAGLQEHPKGVWGHTDCGPGGRCTLWVAVGHPGQACHL